jgi:mannose-6-phosphate isomerase-like protein (cupin superfamily)
MPPAHTRINLADVDDAAPANGFGAHWEARVAREDLDAEQTGLTYFRLRPGKRSPFVHRHRDAEEVYVILSGTGRVRLGNESFGVRALDAIRIAPKTARAFEAGPEGLEFIAFGPHHEADGEPVDDGWAE